MAERRRGQAKTVERSMPAPTGGWNTRDSLSDMREEDAPVLENWFPGQGKCFSRGGFGVQATLSGSVDTLFEHNAGANRILLAACGGTIRNVGAGTTLDTGFSNNRWQGVNFNGRSFLGNGVDTAQDFDGSAIADTTFSGPTLANIVGFAAYKNRVYAWEINSQSFWYGGVNSVSGAMTQFFVNRVSRMGGNILHMENWTHDAGDGPDDYMAIFLNNGEVIVYTGSDPASWVLIGVFRIAPPLSARSIRRVGGDIVIATREDVVLLSEALGKGRVVTDRSKISGAMLEAAQSQAATFGWDVCLYPRGGYMLVNVPQSDGTYDQFVVNTAVKHKPWCRFTGQNAKCWSLWNERLYFGAGDGKVYLADDGDDDNDAAIVLDGQQAWTQFKMRNRKRVTATRPLIQVAGTVSFSRGVGYDFTPSIPVTPATITATGTAWGSAWGSAWSAEDQVDRQWRMASGHGEWVGFRLKMMTETQVQWFGTGFRMEAGTGL